MCFISNRSGLLVVSAMVVLTALFWRPAALAEETPGFKVKLYWDRTVIRADRTETLWLYVEDRTGHQPPLSVTLKGLPDMKIVGEAVQDIPKTAWQQERIFLGGQARNAQVREQFPSARLSWKVRFARPTGGRIEAVVSGEGVNLSETVLVHCQAPVGLDNTDYVPEPVPVDSERLVGMIYFPGWKPGDHYGWHMFERSAPWVKPALGWYDESLPEVTDWEIKWNVEHGVDFFLYCWYRAYGNDGKPVEQMHPHAIHDGLFNARYQDHIKFAIMWTNTDYSGIASRDDLMTNLMPFWIENYFQRSNYLLIDNKPLLAVYDIQRLITDLGSAEAVNETLALMQAACVEAGFDGLWIIAESRHWTPEYLETMASCGFDASFAYCWNNVPDGASDRQARETILNNLRKRMRWNLLPDIPTVSAMWIPWLWEQYAHPGSTSAHYHMSPEGFHRLCRNVKTITDTLPEDHLGRRIVFVDNWNEWGEGHYLAPCQEHGFKYLDVIRDVFTDAPQEHTDLIPDDIGLGPYDTAYRNWLDKRRTEAAARDAEPES